jgi:hypothetical protein
MAINIHTFPRYLLFVCIAFYLILLTSCKPYRDLKEWDLLLISDSSNWGVGQYYAKLIEADIGVKVNLHDCWVGGMPIGSALQALQSGKSLYPALVTSNCQSPWSDDAWTKQIKEAEVMVLFGNPWDSVPPNGAWDIPENPLVTCNEGGYYGNISMPLDEANQKRILNSCAPETFATYKAHLGAFLDEIDKIREGRPLILRITDYYLSFHSVWNENGVDEICTTCISNSLEAVQQVAKEHGVPLANTLVALNGEDYLSDPREAGYIGYDGAHLSEAGAQFVATLLQQTGYSYAGNWFEGLLYNIKMTFSSE